MTKLLLASSSPYRRQLLQRLDLPFEWAAPAIDETPEDGESAQQLAERLSLRKTEALAADYAEHIIIGSDQTASLGDTMLTKPGGFAAAMAQLQACSGREVIFHTGLCVFVPPGKFEVCTVPTRVNFRQLSDRQIETYIRKEQPFDCAGSFKCEGLGISLFSSITSDDPTALVGLPLIQLTSMLDRAGANPLGPVHTHSVVAVVAKKPPI